MDKTLEMIRLVQEGHLEYKERIIEENTGLIWSVVRKFMKRGYEAEDLFQVGAIGLLKCIDKFDLSYEVKFSTYAVPMIVGEIKRFLRDDGMIKVSRPLKEIAVRARYMQEEMTSLNGEAPTLSQLAEGLGVEMEDLVMALDACRDVESLYATVNQQDGGTVYLIDKLDQDEGHDEKMVDLIALREIIRRLKPKERRVVVMRYFQDKTQTEVAKEIGVSQVQVSRIEKKVLKDIRESFV